MRNDVGVLGSGGGGGLEAGSGKVAIRRTARSFHRPLSRILHSGFLPRAENTPVAAGGMQYDVEGVEHASNTKNKNSGARGVFVLLVAREVGE